MKERRPQNVRYKIYIKVKNKQNNMFMDTILNFMVLLYHYIELCNCKSVIMFSCEIISGNEKHSAGDQGKEIGG